MKQRVDGLKGRMKLLVLLAVFAAFSPAGCSNPTSPRPGPAAEPHVLVVRIAGEAAAQARTALPSTPSPVAYNISVSRSGASLGSLVGTNALGTEFPVLLSAAPATGDLVVVEGFDSDPKKCAGGSLILPSGYTAGDSVAIALRFSTGGTGSVDLSVSLPVAGTDGEITAAELALYRSLADYQGGAIYRLMRYRKEPAYGAGTDLGGNLGGSVPIKFDDLPSGDYVVQIEFFRSRFVRVSRLVQTIIVREGLATTSWDGGGSVLSWDKFASSNADLNGISIGANLVTPVPGRYSYSITESASSAGSPVLTITKGTMGQTVEAKLTAPDGTTTAPQSGDTLQLKLGGTNSLVITVTAPDGVTRQTYTVSYTYVYSGTEWYVDQGGNDGNPGTSAGSSYALQSVAEALKRISSAYNNGASWPGYTEGNPAPARINISGTITISKSPYTAGDTMTSVDGSAETTGLPPIILSGTNPATDKIDAGSGTKRALLITNAKVTLESGLALTGGGQNNGCGAMVAGNGSFTMNGGTITGNNTTNGGSGGGVYVWNSSFTMNGGTIAGNNITGSGGGVNVNGGTFTMNGGAISGNIASSSGGGVYVAGGSFTMNGGTIGGSSSADKNTAASGGGVYVSGGSFTMSGGTISGNSAGRGGGVYVNSSGGFILKGGSISENTATGSNATLDGGGGVYVASGSFTMSKGAISGNTSGTATQLRGGGVFVTGNTSSFTMEGGTISENIATGNGNDGGGGVFVRDYGSFTLKPGAFISGNTANGGGGGVNITNNGRFEMSGGTIDGNIATGNGGGVLVKETTTFTRSGGTISGNTAEADGGGVFVAGSSGVYAAGSFTMNSGAVSGNTAKANGGGVYVAGSFTMNSGAVNGNTAEADGGGVHVAGGGTFIMRGGNVSGNTTNHEGGGVDLYGEFTMDGGTITGNTSTWSGGGVLVGGSGTFIMYNGTVSGNNSIKTVHDGVHKNDGGSFAKSGGTVDSITS